MNRISPLIFLMIVCLSIEVDAQKMILVEKLHSNFSKSENRLKERNKIKQEIKEFLQLERNKTNEKTLIRILENAELYFIKSEQLRESISKDFDNWKDLSIKYKRALLKYIAANYKNEFAAELTSVYNSTLDPEIFAITTNLLMNLPNAKSHKEFLAELETRFTGFVDSPILLMLRRDLLARINGVNIPPLVDILKHNFQDSITIIYSFFRTNRTLPGISIVKKPDGKFVRDDKGEIFSITQLACSASELPGYIFGGNTPQGIFSIVGYYITPTESIGPTPIILTRIPFEKPTKIFYHGKQENNTWRNKEYQELLPESWKNYLPIHESFYAGIIGRKLIIMHGSVDDLEYYSEKTYYPQTPSRGCITAKEIWDGKTGKCLESDQAKLANAFFSANNLKGFLVVIDLDDKNMPVTLDDIAEYCKEAELATSVK